MDILRKYSCSASTVYNGIFNEGLYPDSGPVSSSIRFRYKLKNGKDLDLYWMDGGITPERPNEIDPDVNMNEILCDYPLVLTIMKEEHCL